MNAKGTLLLGDNFYAHGVQKSTSVRFAETFEDVYTPAMFHDLPFYVVAGNHDWLGPSLFRTPRPCFHCSSAQQIRTCLTL